MAQKNLKPYLDVEKTIGSDEMAPVLIGIRTIPEVITDENGERKVTKKILGFAYDCIALPRKFAPFTVKILEQKAPLFPLDEEIPDNTQVNFIGLTSTLYVQASGTYRSVAISFKADKVEVVNE